MTWGKSSAHEEFLENMVQFGWLGILTSSFSSQLKELGIDQIIDQDSFWMKMILNKEYILSMMLMRKLFL